jgi:hypothetical protein
VQDRPFILGSEQCSLSPLDFFTIDYRSQPTPPKQIPDSLKRLCENCRILVGRGFSHNVSFASKYGFTGDGKLTISVILSGAKNLSSI